MEPRAQAREQLLLSPIPNGISGRVRADGNVETDDRTPRADIRQIEMAELAPLEPVDLLMGGSRLVTDIT